VEQEASEINAITAILRGKFIHLHIYAILRQNIKMKPIYTALHANRTRKEMSIISDAGTGFLCRDSLKRKVSSFAENMAGKIDRILALHKLATIAAQSSLIQPLIVAYHRKPENIPADNQETMQKIGIKELP
jgi:hypothetical protein